MPIRPEMRSRYPADWQAIRELIRARAGNRCERCGVPNHVFAVRERVLGAILADSWRVAKNKRDAEQLRTHWELSIYKTTGQTPVLHGPTQIICTVAHTPDPTPENCDPDNLEFLCQCCHLAEDQPRKLEERRRLKMTIVELSPAGVVT